MKLFTENKFNWLGVRGMNQNDCVSVVMSRWLKASVTWGRVWAGIHFFSIWHNSPQWARASSFTRFLVHTQRRTTVGRTPLDEWLDRHTDLYLTTHNRQTSMPPVRFEPTISAGERPLGPAAFTLQLRKTKGNFSQNSPKRQTQFVPSIFFLHDASTGLLISSPFQLRVNIAVEVYSKPWRNLEFIQVICYRHLNKKFWD